MGSEWQELTIDDLKANHKGSIAMGPFGSRIKAENFVKEGVPIIKGGNLHGTVVLDQGFDFLTEEKAEELKSSQAFRGDLVITHRGTIGQVSIIPNDSQFKKYIVSQSQLKVTLNEELVDPFFVNYFFQSHIGQHRLLANASQVGVPAIAKASTSVKEILVPVPPLPEQKAITHILGSLDDKIELNRQMNATLESMAQALFKSWFVDFDPVIDNALVAGNAIPEELAERADVRRKALADGTANREVAKQFPDAFQLTEELGWVPEGWEVVNIGSIASITKGVSYKSAELTESKTALVTLKSFKRGGGYRLDGLKEYVGKFKTEQKVQAGDLILAYTDVTQAADVIGKPAMVIANSKYDTLVISLDVAVIRPHSEFFRYYLYGLAKTIHFQNHTESYSTGTTVLHLKKEAVPSYIFAHPQEHLLLKYQNFAQNIFREIQIRIEQNGNLESLRDTLLPKLISGELRIPDAEKLVEDALV